MPKAVMITIHQYTAKIFGVFVDGWDERKEQDMEEEDFPCFEDFIDARDHADDLKAQFEAKGAEVEIKQTSHWYKMPSAMKITRQSAMARRSHEEARERSYAV